MVLSFNPKKQLSEFLSEDIGKGDITSDLLSKKKITATIISRENAVVAGVNYVKDIFKIKKCNVKILKKMVQKLKQIKS